MDMVPFLSVDSVRHFFNNIALVEAHQARWSKRMQWITGIKKPDASLIESVQRASTERLPPKPGAPLLAIPAATNVWMREQGRRRRGSGRYDVKLCDSERLATLGVHIDLEMLTDHFPPRYEHAFHHLSE